MEEFLTTLCTAFLSSVVAVFNQQRGRKFKKKVLLTRFTKDGWEWRSLKSLRRSIGEDEYNTKELLLEIGARASTGNKDVWTLEK